MGHLPDAPADGLHRLLVGGVAVPDPRDDPPEEEPSGIPSRTVARALLVLLLLLLFGAVLSTWWYLSVHDRHHAEPEEGPSLALRGALLG